MLGFLIINPIGPKYTASMIVTATPNANLLGDHKPGLTSQSTIMGLGGGAASLLLRGSKLSLYEKLLQSDTVAAAILRKNPKLVVEMYDGGVDAAEHWRPSPTAAFKRIAYTAPELQSDITSGPTVQDVELKISNLIAITEYSDDPNITSSVSCTCRSAVSAAIFSNDSA